MRHLLAALLLMSLALPAAAAGKREIVHDGKTRRFYVEYPAGPRPGPRRAFWAISSTARFMPTVSTSSPAVRLAKVRPCFT